MLQSFGIKIDKDIATCIYTALAEDTNFFTTKSVTKEVFLLASTLMELGANPAFIAENLTQRDSLAKVRLRGLFINTISLIKDGKVAIGEVLEEDFLKSGALRYDTTEFVDILLQMHTVELAIFILALPDGDYKFSLRSKHIDVSSIAVKLGGGGHKYAAGLEVAKAEKDTMLKQIINEVHV